MTGDAGRWRSRSAGAGLVALTLIPPVLSQPSTDTSALAWGLLAGYEAVAAAGLLLRRRLPVASFLVVTGALVTVVVGGAAEGTKLSTLVFLPLAVSLYSVGSHCASWSRTALAALGGGALVLLGLAINRGTVSAGDFRGGSDVLAVLAPMPLAWAMGFGARSHRESLAATEQRARDALREERSQTEQAARRERVRIAREMHDVVAHSLTLLVVHAEALRARGADLPPWARTELDGLALAGRQAVGELRDLLRVLRDPRDAPLLRPTPGFGDLPALLDSCRAAGECVEVRIEADPDAVPTSVQLAGYRVVQESLANARRHAPGEPVRLTVAEDDGRLRVEVANGPAASAPAGPGTGLGLVSMRERVNALGGDLRAGPTEDGGFRVVALLPLETARV